MANLRPRVIRNIDFIGSLFAPAGVGIAAMIGTAKWGELDTVTRVSNLQQFTNTFGGEKSTDGLTGIKAADVFFANGGVLKFVRIADGNEAKATYTLQNSNEDLIDLTALYNGTLGNDISIEVTENDSNRNVYIRYDNVTESFTNAGVGYSTADDIIDAINDNSDFVVASLSDGASGDDLPDALSPTNMTGGDDGDSSLADSDYIDAINNLLWDEEYDYLLIPGKTDDSFQNNVSSLMSNRETQNNMYSSYISGVDAEESISSIADRTSSGYRIRLVAPGIKYINLHDGSEQILDGSYLACAVAGRLCTLDTERSGTRQQVAVNDLIIDDSSNKKYYSKDEQSQLLETNVIPVALTNNSIRIIRDITRNSDKTSPLFEGVIVEISDFVSNELEEYLEGKLGKPNTSDNRKTYESDIDSRFETWKRQGIIENYSESSVEEGGSPDTIIANVSFKPAYATNFVQLNIVVQ